MSEKVKQLTCSICGKSHSPEPVEYTCPTDGGNLTVELDAPSILRHTRRETITGSNDFSMWRYLPLLPVEHAGPLGMPIRQVGWTPVYRPRPLGDSLGLRQLWLKDESRNPTASFKDRASALVVQRAAEVGADVIVTASSGNAGAALAGMAAAVGMRAVILVPKSAPAPKVAQLRVYGAQVFLVEGTYDDAFDLTIEASQAFNWYCRNTGYNPYTAEGKKTAAYEIWEQVLLPEDLEQPLNIFVSVGDGNIIASLHKGFKDLIALGLWERMPRLFGIQAQGAASLVHAYEASTEDFQAVSADTLADSISVGLPRDGLRALRAATETGGAYLSVPDDSILEAIRELGSVGIFSEPAAAAAYAGLKKAVDQTLIQPNDPALVLLTGSGLKDPVAAIQAAGPAPIIEPTLAALKTELGL
jgi:threonine synthase